MVRALPLPNTQSPEFAIQIIRFAKEYFTSFSYSKACEYANFTFIKGLNDIDKERALENAKEAILECLKPHIDKHIARYKETINITGARVLLEIEKVAMQDLSAPENYYGNIENPRIIISANEKLKALGMLARHLGLFETDNLQKYSGTSINIDNSVNKQEISNLEIENKSITLNIVNDKKDILNDVDIKDAKKTLKGLRSDSKFT